MITFSFLKNQIIITPATPVPLDYLEFNNQDNNRLTVSPHPSYSNLSNYNFNSGIQQQSFATILSNEQ